MIEVSLDGYISEPITIDNIDKYEDVFYCNTEYYMLTDGHTATKSDCIETIELTVDGIPKSNYHNIGFCDKEEPMACMFLIEGYPVSDVLWLGLFLVHDKYKRQMIGTRCIKALIEALEKSPIKYIRLSVQDNNVSGLAFWKHMGFSVIEKTDCETFTNLTMEYVI